MESIPDADVPSRAPRFVVAVDDDDGTVQVAVDGQSFVVPAWQAFELAGQFHKALRYLAGSSLIAGTDIPIDLEPASKDPTFHEDTLYRTRPDAVHPDRPTVTIRGDNPAQLIRITSGPAEIQLDYETTRVLERAIELAARIGNTPHPTSDRQAELEANRLALEETLGGLDAAYFCGTSSATPVTWYGRTVFKGEAKPDKVPPIPGFVIAAEAKDEVVALRVGNRSFRVDVASAKVLLRALATARRHLFFAQFQAEFHADIGVPAEPAVLFDSRPSKRYPNRAAVRVTVHEDTRRVTVVLNGVGFPVDSDAVEGMRSGLTRAIDALVPSNRAITPESMEKQSVAVETEEARLRVVERAGPTGPSSADAAAQAMDEGGLSDVSEPRGNVASPAAPEPQQAGGPGQCRDQDDPFADDRAEYLMARNIRTGGRRGPVEIALQIAVVIGFFLTLASLSTVLGGWTLVLAVIAFPVTLVIGPVYVALALGQWLPLALVYGATAVLIGSAWIGSRRN